MLFHFFFSLCLGIVLNMMAAAQRIATELSSTRAAAVATSTGDDALLELLSATLCSGQVRRTPRDEAIMAYASLCLEAPLPIREMITAATEMTRGNINGWVHFDMKKKQRTKVYALQEYIARANKSVLEFFFNTWQASWAKLFDA